MIDLFWVHYWFLSFPWNCSLWRIISNRNYNQWFCRLHMWWHTCCDKKDSWSSYQNFETWFLQVLTLKKMRDFYSYESDGSNKCTEELSQEASCSSQAPDGEISGDVPFYPPPAFCFPKTEMVIIHANLVSSRNFLSYITIRGKVRTKHFGGL